MSKKYHVVGFWTDRFDETSINTTLSQREVTQLINAHLMREAEVDEICADTRYPIWQGELLIECHQNKLQRKGDVYIVIGEYIELFISTNRKKALLTFAEHLLTGN